MTAKIPSRGRIIRRKKSDMAKAPESGVALPVSSVDNGQATAATEPEAPTATAAPPPDRPRLDSDALMVELDGMSSDDFAALMGAGMPVRHSAGDRVEGRVVRVSGGVAFVDVGGKAEAVLTIDATAPGPARGDTIRAYVESVGDYGIRLSQTLGGEGAMQALEHAFESGESIDGKVGARNPGGFTVRMGSVQAFCPVSQIDRLPDTDLDQYVGRTLAFRVIEIRDGDVVVSHRAVAEEAIAEDAAALWDRVQEGDVLDGIIAAVKDFGAFVDVDGVRGLVPRREIGWGHDVAAPPPGTAVRVRVLNVDRAAERLTLSLKDEGAGPWSRVGKDFLIGGDYSGRVSRVTDFGAFVSLAPGLDGLVHISELSNERVARTEDAVNVGDTVKVRVLDVDFDRSRIQLSVKQAGTGDGAPRPKPPADTGKLGTLGDLFAGLKLR